VKTTKAELQIDIDVLHVVVLDTFSRHSCYRYNNFIFYLIAVKNFNQD